MTFPASEASIHGGKPTVLYRFELEDPGVPYLIEPIDQVPFDRPAAPASPGQMIVPWYTPAEDLGISIGDAVVEGASCILGISHYDGIIVGNVATICAVHNGGIAEVGHYYRSFKYTSEHGLLPNRDYIARALVGHRTAQGFAHGIRFGGSFDSGPEDALAYVDFPVTSTAGSEIPFELGHYDMPSGYVNIVYLAGLAIFGPALEGDPNDAGIPGGSTTGRTSFRRTVTYQGESYSPCEIEHTEPSHGVEDAPGTIQISLPADDPLVAELRSPIPPSRPMVTIFEYHRPPVNEPDPANVIKTLYDIISVEDQTHNAVLTCASILGQGEDVVPSGLIQKEQCMFPTFGLETCGVNPLLHTFTGIVSAIDELSVTVTGASSFSGDDLTYFALGSLSKGLKRTMIQQQEGDVMLLDQMIPGLIVGDTVKLLAGDTRRAEICRDRFHNSARRFSFPNLPVSNPYYGQGLRP